MANPSQGRPQRWDIETHVDDSRLLMHSQLLITQEFIKQMRILREEYVKRGLDKELEFQ